VNHAGTDIGDEVWCEDECLRHDPDAERIEDAWEHFFGVPMLSKNSATKLDWGDCFVYLFDDGRSAVMSHNGWSIHAANFVNLRRFRNTKLRSFR